MPVTRTAPVVIGVVNDVHAGSTVAICPDHIRLDDGGEYHASVPQRWLFNECWQDFWQRVADRRTAVKASLYHIFNGDLVEGQHHGTTQVLNGNPNAQAAALAEIMRTPLAQTPDRLYIVRGTGAHTGPSSASEERYADGLRRDKRPIVSDPDTGNASFWHLRLDVQGVLLDVAHHGRTGQREHTRAGAAALHAHDVALSHWKRGDRVPNLCLRAHYHRFNDSHDAVPQCRVVTNGAWQLKSEYVHKVAADSMADIGGLIVTIDGGEYTVEKVHYPYARGSILEG